MLLSFGLTKIYANIYRSTTPSPPSCVLPTILICDDNEYGNDIVRLCDRHHTIIISISVSRHQIRRPSPLQIQMFGNSESEYLFGLIFGVCYVHKYGFKLAISSFTLFKR